MNSLRSTLLTTVAAAALVGGCGSDDGSTTSTAPAATDDSGSADLTAVAEATGTCLLDAGFTDAIPADIFVVETEEAVDPEDGYSVLAVDADDLDIQVMIFADASLADGYTKDAASDDDNIMREPVANGQVVVESGFSVDGGGGLEDPADQAILDQVETCVTDAGL